VHKAGEITNNRRNCCEGEVLLLINEKKRYYISVQSQTIMEHQGDASYELEIEANAEELQKLNELFELMDEFDQSSFLNNPVPGIPYHHDLENDGYDYYLKEIYKFLYDNGTEKTKSHIQSMNILT
jgi:hypothetical protein